MRFREWLERVINEDYKTVLKKFERDNPNLDSSSIKKYLDDFKKIAKKRYKQIFDNIEGVSVPKEKRTNIDSYKTFEELESFVDYVRGQVPVSGSFGEQIDVDAKPIFESDKLVVYYADSARACIKYKGNFPYSWCIARKDAGNLFNAYRFKENEPAFYFVKNKDKTKKEFEFWNVAKTVFSGEFKDPWHFFVVQVSKNAKTDDQTKKQYIVTNAQNDGETVANWEYVVSKEPLLEGLQELLKPVPLSPGEREDYEFFKKGMSDEEFKKLSYEQKNRFLDIYVNLTRGLTDDKFASLPEDLKNKYVGFGIGLTEKQYDLIRGTKLEKRYSDVVLEKSKRIIKGEFEEIENYSLNNTELESIKDRLDYGSISLEDIGKLVGFYSEPTEIEDDEGEIEETGGWQTGWYGEMDALDEILDRYLSNSKKPLQRHEKEILRKLYKSQTKSLRFYDLERMGVRQLEQELLKRNFKGGKFREEKIKELFEKKKEEILLKDRISHDEMNFILSYSEDQENTIKRINDSALVFESGQIEYFSKILNHEAMGLLVSRMEDSKNELPNHPLIILYAKNPDGVLEKMNSTNWNLDHFVGVIKESGRFDPNKIQKLIEKILATNKGQLHWAIKWLIEKSPDPSRSIAAAVNNAEIFSDVGQSKDNINNLLEFIVKKFPSHLQSIIDNISSSLSRDYKSIPIILNYSPNKARTLQFLSDSVVSKLEAGRGLSYGRGQTWRRDIAEVLSTIESAIDNMSKEDVKLIKDKFKDSKLKEKINKKLLGPSGYVKSLNPEDFDQIDDYERYEIFPAKYLQMINDPNISQEEKTEISDEVLAKKSKFDFYNVDFLRHVAKNSSDKNWALRTIIQKTIMGSVSEYIKHMKDFFPHMNPEAILDLVLDIKKTNLSNAQIESFLSLSKDKDKVARIVGIERLKKIAKDYPYYHSSKEYLTQKG